MAEETDKTLQVKVSLRAMSGKLQERLQNAMDVVTFGFTAADNIEDELDPLPSVVQFSPAANAAMAVDDARDHFKQWIVTSNLRDCIEAYKAFLDEVWLVCSIYRLASRGRIRGAEWQEATGRGAKRFHFFGLGRKLETLQKEFDSAVVPPSNKMVREINKARNCLVHRNGQVGEQDVNCDDGLRVTWLLQEVGLRKPDGEEVIIDELPFHAEEDGLVFLRQRKTERTFGVGSEIRFTAEDFSHLCWTMFVVSNETTQRVEEYGRRLGLEFEERDEAESARAGHE